MGQMGQDRVQFFHCFLLPLTRSISNGDFLFSSTLVFSSETDQLQLASSHHQRLLETMAELTIASQSSLLLPKFQSRITSIKSSRSLIGIQGSTLTSNHTPLSISRVQSVHQVPLPAFSHLAQQNYKFLNRFSAVSDSTISNLTTNLETPDIDVKLDNLGGGGFGGDGNGGSGGGGGGGGGGGDENDEGWEEENDESEGKRAKALSMSQKLTLGYAALVGFGGLMGFVKSGSQKSLAAGGVSALVLYYVYTQLPTKPVFASSIGLGMSAALLVVMGSRFKKSGKVMPAGVVSLVSLVMTGGYLHGIFRSAH
ncbi:hypothetical protein V2J09_009909 [Rumex salicifolius]